MVQVGFLRDPPANIPQTYLPANHWFQKLRQNTSALFLKHESHYERFIAYDAEVAIPIPVKIRGGPDEYTLQNLTNRRLLDVAVIAPTDNGFRVGWLDELPTATPEKTDESDGKKEEPAAEERRSGRQEEGRAAGKKEEALEEGRTHRRPDGVSRRRKRRRRTKRKQSRRCRPRAMRTCAPASTSCSTGRSR